MGAVLRQERLRQNLTLSDITARVRVPEHFLEAIEKEKFESLPGAFFIRSFVRQYAIALEIDPEPMLAELPNVDIASTPFSDPRTRVQTSGWDPRWNSALASVAWCGLAIAAAAAAYIHINHPLPGDPGWMNSGTAAQAGDAGSPSSSPPKQASGAAAQPLAPVRSAGGAAAQAGSRAAAVQVAALPPDSALRPIQVVLTAHEPSWLEVTADGKAAFTGTLEPNDSRSITADELVKLLIGNAGGIAISLNGKPLDSLGPSGQVRNVKLTAEGLQFVQKTQPAVDPL